MDREQMRKTLEAELGLEKIEELKKLVHDAAVKVNGCTAEQKDAIAAVVMVFSLATRKCTDLVSQEALITTAEMIATMGRQDCIRMQRKAAVGKMLDKEVDSDYSTRFHEGNSTKH
jgi:hypothetical protein